LICAPRIRVIGFKSPAGPVTVAQPLWPTLKPRAAGRGGRRRHDDGFSDPSCAESEPQAAASLRLLVDPKKKICWPFVLGILDDCKCSENFLAPTITTPIRLSATFSIQIVDGPGCRVLRLASGMSVPGPGPDHRGEFQIIVT
jgi:hypothetical protein